MMKLPTEQCMLNYGYYWVSQAVRSHIIDARHVVLVEMVWLLCGVIAMSVTKNFASGDLYP